MVDIAIIALIVLAICEAISDSWREDFPIVFRKW